MYQQLTLVGNLGTDPEMRYMPDGQAVTNFSLACNRRWTDRNTGQPQEEVTWFRVSVWGRQAEAAHQYLNKGRQVLIEGRLRPDPTTGGPRLWERNDGSVGASFEVVADRVQFLGGSNGNGNGSNGHTANVTQPEYEEDDIPF
ncbi:MAG: single-stranded DNA-binding protein [Ardenticatenaceae bacterium]|nr:single-stranded DNA-binding protein [Ardenticatenaceae bacterium]